MSTLQLNLLHQAASAIYAAAWSLKDAATVPADFADDQHWPQSEGAGANVDD